MSAAKMVADSTVSSDLLGDRRKRRKSGSNKHSKRTRKNSKNEGKGHHYSEDSDSDLDLEKDLKAIGEYIKDRTEMLDNMFSAVRGQSLKRALPDILLELPLDELKQRCLEQLEIMSKKRIRRIIEGANPADISSSGTDDSSGEDKEELVEVESFGTGEEIEEIEYIEVEEEVEVSDFEEEGSVAKEVESGEDTLEEIMQDGESEGQNDDENVSNDETPTKSNENEELSDSGTLEKDQGQAKVAIAPILTKDQMEILELEMRARAIKAMLNKQPKALSVDAPGVAAESTHQQKPVELGSKTDVSKGTGDKFDTESYTLKTKPHDGLEEKEAVSTEEEITNFKKTLQRRQFKNRKAAIEARVKAKMFESQSTGRDNKSLNKYPEPSQETSNDTQGKTVSSNVDAEIQPDQASRKDPVYADNDTDPKSLNEASVCGSKHFDAEISSNLPEEEGKISENIPIDSSDTEEGEVTSADEDH